jgi:hypothetical protein
MIRVPSARLAFAIALPFVHALASSPARAGNVEVNFSGGNGAPLTITLPHPIRYDVVNDTSNPGANFVFQGTGNATGGTVRAVTGTISYTLNGGTRFDIDSAGTFALGVVSSDDLSLFRNSSPGLALGDIMLLDVGTVSTTTTVAAAPPSSGFYSTILVDNNGVQLGTGAYVPEPACACLAALAAISLCRARRRCLVTHSSP